MGGRIPGLVNRLNRDLAHRMTELRQVQKDAELVLVTISLDLEQRGKQGHRECAQPGLCVLEFPARREPEQG